MEVEYPTSSFSIYRANLEERNGFDNLQTTMLPLFDGENYLPGDYLPTIKEQLISNESMIGGSNEVLFHPNSNDAGFCNDFDAVKFGRQSDNGCVRMIRNLSSECATSLSIDQYIRGTFGKFGSI